MISRNVSTMVVQKLFKHLTKTTCCWILQLILYGGVPNTPPHHHQNQKTYTKMQDGESQDANQLCRHNYMLSYLMGFQDTLNGNHPIAEMHYHRKSKALQNNVKISN